jgi:hypothetical protein
VAGELAAGIAGLVSVLPERTRSDLRALLARDIAAPPPERERAARLSLLCERVRRGGGEVPGVDLYETARRQGREDAPSASTLSRTYGGWVRAVRAAAWLAAGASGPAPAARLLPRQRPYTQDEALGALELCRSDLGSWPSAAEYEEWAHLRRRLQRRFGGGDARTPGLSVLTRLFGGIGAAEAVARHDAEAPRRQRR